MGKIDYKLVRSRRRNICLTVRNGELIVRAPALMPIILINRFISSKVSWIEKHLEKSKPTFIRHYKEGEKFLFLGKELFLSLIKTNLPKPEIKIDGNKIIILSYDVSKPFLKIQIERFYKDKTIQTVKKLIEKYDPKFNGKLTFKSYQSKWGSCTGKNDLSFNTKLAMAPIEVIEYVVIHELSHIKQKNHSKNFWKLVAEIDSEYNKRRKWLRVNHERLVL
jgi:predicted metal-dependent hydrolase